MMKISGFEFSDTISGYVVDFDKAANTFRMETSDGRMYNVILGINLYARILRNLDEPYIDCTAQVPELLEKGQMVFAYGVYYPKDGEYFFEAKALDFPGKKPGKYRFEEPDWWIKQVEGICKFYLRAQFGKEHRIDYRQYCTQIDLTGERKGHYENNFRQETDTISRLVYGFATAFLFTGNDEYLEAAEKGTQYLRDHMRFYDVDENIIYWYHGIKVSGEKEDKIFASEFGDDYDAIPAYEQIYALAGPTQAYRINGDPRIMKDIRMTIDLFDRFFLDREKGGYFSHLDPVTLDPRSESLGRNRAKKNWNSVGDHAPAYLINLCLASGEKKHIDFLKSTADCIVERFPDYAASPFVQEKFFEDWSKDQEWGWQQNRAVIGHNLKIAWNLMRINSVVPDQRYVKLAEKIAALMPESGMDRQRFGWYDVVERMKQKGEQLHRFAWHDRKAWWQQEQGILAYQILYGILKKPAYLKIGRESTAFYNTFFLDHDDGAVYFNVLANGIPFLVGTERLKGSHSMSGYHSTELCYLAQVYTNLLHTKQPLVLHFKPHLDGFPDGILRVQPDFLPPGSVKITEVMVDSSPWRKFDATGLSVELPNSNHRPKIKVTLTPVEG
jgi:mannose/cellobiose epimerase-like protein (N-acyl-D-glucosamine 2-epimerase family)